MESIFSYLTSFIAPKEHFTNEVILIQNPLVKVGIQNGSALHSGIMIHEDPKIYKYIHFRKMDNGYLYMFEDDIRLRIFVENDFIVLRLFSIKHDLSFASILTNEEIEILQHIRFGNHYYYTYYCELDYMFDFIDRVSEKIKEKWSHVSQVPFLVRNHEYKSEYVEGEECV